MADHPFKGPYDARDAAALLAATKLHIRMVMADADEVRNTNLAGQFAGVYVVANRANYRLDTEDLQGDDGINVIHSLDGMHFIKAAEVVSPTISTYADDAISDGAISIGEDDDIALINTTSPVNVIIPAAATRNSRTLLIKDSGGQGFTPVTTGEETVDSGPASDYAVMTPKGWLELGPVVGGYFVKGAQL